MNMRLVLLACACLSCLLATSGVVFAVVWVSRRRRT